VTGAGASCDNGAVDEMLEPTDGDTMTARARVVVLAASARLAGTPRTFDYAVSPALQARVAPGHLVSIPFGARLVPGVVWAVVAPETMRLDSGEAALRPIAALLDPHPLLDASRMRLAEWLADRYSCPLALAVRLMLPPGLLQGTRVVLRPLQADVVADATGPTGIGLRDEAAVLGAVRSRGQLDERAVSRSLGGRRAQQAVSALLAAGAVERAAVALAVWRASAHLELDALAPISNTTPIPSASLPRGPGERRAERILRQLAVLDLLARRAGGGSAAESEAGWRLAEVRKLTRITGSALSELQRAGLIALETVEARHDPLAGRAIPATAPLELTGEQRDALAAILGAGRDGTPGVVLLHGVTGSGKTEVYLQALAAHLAAGRRGIVLVPEIALTPQAMMRYAGRFPGRVALLHSGLSEAERLDQWRRIRAGLVDVVVGSRSALFAPVERLGLIVVDEEHETAYKQEERAPTYHARDAAVALGRIAGAAVVLGSATPSVESSWRAHAGEYRLIELQARAPTGPSARLPALPAVTVVDLRAELRAGNTSILGEAMQTALHETLDAGQQAILFLNRRGTASSVICRECGYVARCGQCDVPMAYHASDSALICHYCGRRQDAPRVCPHCWSTSIRYFGIGTERVEAAVKRLMPRARVLRWDRDTARTRQTHEQLLAAFVERRADVLVGTQMIAKGLDLPAVTLVGVVSADVALYLPDFRAQERAFQLLTQVAGRAGRGDTPGRVIIQTFNPNHFCIEAAAGHDYDAFYSAEIVARERFSYPPFRQFVKFVYTHRDRHQAQVEATALGGRMEAQIAALALERTDVVGPAPCFMERLRGAYRWQLIARGPDLRPLLGALAAEDALRGWAVDVDPANTL
jgi:primosomal protein N' (replication factor Y) (superfamily II helicase)